MRIHFYRYRLKILIKNRNLILWTCLFPLMIATAYFMIFYNVSEDKRLVNLPIAIQEVDEMKSVGEYLSSIKNKDGISLFLVSYASGMEGESLLLNNQIDAFISYDNNLIIHSRERNNKILLQTYLDIYREKIQIQDEILGSSSENHINEDFTHVQKINELLYDKTENYVTNETVANGSKLHYFYAIIALACILGSSLGFKEMLDFYGEGSFIGLKIEASTMEKKHLLISDIAAIMTIHISSVLILLFYLIVVLNVINNPNPIILLVVFIGSFVGISMGASIYLLLQANKRVKRAVLNTFIIIGSIISGLFNPKINYYITTKVPIIHYLNPASLITNTFYNLLFKEDQISVFVNLSILLNLGILLGFLAVTSLKRRHYASI